MKKILSLLICISISLAMITSAHGESETLIYGDFEYTLSPDGTAVITKFNGSQTNLVIPYVLDGHPVKSIGDYAFTERPLNAVIIEDGIESIGNYSFENCSQLRKILIPESVKAIGNHAFDSCTSLTAEVNATDLSYSSGNISEADIKRQEKRVESEKMKLERWIEGGKKSEKDIEKQRSKIKHEEEKLEQMKAEHAEVPEDNFIIPAGTGLLPGKLERIGDYAFSSCHSLVKIFIPDSVISVGKAPFALCINLEIIVSPDHPYLATNNGAFYSKPDKRLICVSRYAKNYEIPRGILIIDDYACVSQSNTQITIPDSVTAIGDYAFLRCEKLSHIDFGKGITSIGAYAFYNCYSMRELTIPGSVTSIGKKAFPDITKLTVVPGSAAETYCKENYYSYQYAESDMDWLTD